MVVGPALRWKTSVWSQLEAIQPRRIRPQAVLWLLTGDGAEGEGDEEDVNMLGFSQRGKATTCIPTSLPG